MLLPAFVLGWPGPYICTVYDRKFGDDLPKIRVYIVNIYVSGQPYMCVHLCVPVCVCYKKAQMCVTPKNVLPSKICHPLCLQL